MKYQLLKIFKYNGSLDSKTEEEVENEYKDRLDGYSTIKTSLYPSIKNDFQTLVKYPLFYVSTNKINSLSNKIILNSKRIIELSEHLPNVARDKYITNMIIEDIVNTNDIEGIKTNTQQIGTIVEDLKKDKIGSNPRFTSVVKTYLDTINKETIKIHDFKDIRDIYDRLLSSEIPDKLMPDGEFFRNSGVYVGYTSEIIHTPPANEQSIKSQLVSLISFMNDENIPFLPKSIVTHFMLENIHPFYDGNGRLGRYLISSYLAKKLDVFTAMSVSSAINAEQRSYWRVFREVEDIDNKADATLFVTRILEIMLQGQNDTIIKLKEQNSKLRRSLNVIEEKFGENKLEVNIMFLIAQSDLFSSSTDYIQDNEIINVLKDNYKKKDIKNEIEELEASNFIIKTKKRPSKHMLNPDKIKITD